MKMSQLYFPSRKSKAIKIKKENTFPKSFPPFPGFMCPNSPGRFLEEQNLELQYNWGHGKRHSSIYSVGIRRILQRHIRIGRRVRTRHNHFGNKTKKDPATEDI